MPFQFEIPFYDSVLALESGIDIEPHMQDMVQQSVFVSGYPAINVDV